MIMTCASSIRAVAAVPRFRTVSSSLRWTSSEATPGAPSKKIDDHIPTILRCALHHVPEKGWTEDALTAGVFSAKLPPSMVGLVTNRSSDLVSFFMEDCNHRLESDLNEIFVPVWDKEETPLSQRIESCIKARLEMVKPFVKVNRWHEGMALGIQNTNGTVNQLDSLINIIMKHTKCSAGPLEKAAIGSVYVTTELHMLADTSDDFQETWKFLGERMAELEAMADAKNNGTLPNISKLSVNPVTAAAVTAVASSLGSAVVSLAMPAARGTISALASTVVPQIGVFMQSINGKENNTITPIRESEFPVDDLPPFENATNIKQDDK